MKGNNNIDRYFRENLYDFQVTPPEGVWDTIEQDLKNNTRKLVLPMYIKVAAGVVLLVSLAAILWRVADRSDTRSNTILTEEVDPSESIIENTEAVEIADKEEQVKLIAQSESIETSTGISHSADNAKVNIEDKESSVIIPVDFQDQQEEIEQVVIPVEQDTKLTTSEIRKEEVTQTETTDIQKKESAEKINKNDLIIQQNLLALEESSEESVNRSDSRWSIGGQAGPQYSYRDVSVNPDYQNFQDYDKFEDGMIAFAGGVNVQLQAAKRFSIQSGVYYSKIGQEVSSFIYGDATYQTDVVADEPNSQPSIGTVEGISKDYREQAPMVNYNENNISEGSFFTEQYFEFVEIPLVFKYYIVNRKLDISLNGGIWTNILVGNTAITTGDNDYYVKEETNNVNTLNYSGSLGVGFNYPITSNLLISLDPIFKYYLSPINSNPETEVHPYTFGIMTGINFNF